MTTKPADPTPPLVVASNPPAIDSAGYQALIRALRYVGATVLAAVVTVIPQLLIAGHIDPALSVILAPILAAFLQGIGKYLRGPSVDVGPGQVVIGGTSDVPDAAPATPAASDKLPF